MYLHWITRGIGFEFDSKFDDPLLPKQFDLLQKSLLLPKFGTPSNLGNENREVSSNIKSPHATMVTSEAVKRLLPPPKPPRNTE